MKKSPNAGRSDSERDLPPEPSFLNDLAKRKPIIFVLQLSLNFLGAMVLVLGVWDSFRAGHFRTPTVPWAWVAAAPIYGSLMLWSARAAARRRRAAAV